MFTFSTYLTVLGYTLFAIWMTYLMARIMSLSSFKLEHLKTSKNLSDRVLIRRRKRQQLKIAAARYDVISSRVIFLFM